MQRRITSGLHRTAVVVIAFVAVGVNWQFAQSFVAKAGYRYFYQDYEDNGFVWDMAAHGFYLGLGIRF